MAILAVLSRGPASRAVIARELDLSPATVSQVTRRLISQGVVETLSFAPSDGGRPGQLLGLVGGAGHAIGVKLAADHVVLVDVGLDGQVLSRRTETFDAVSADAIERLVEILRRMSGEGRGRLLGIGVGVPGVVVHPDVGTVDTAVLGWSNMPLGAYLRRVTGVPVLIENDVKALAVAEHVYGRGRERENFAVITIGRGLGFARFARGALDRGAHGAAGELGHVVIVPGGAQCACGNRGCLEAYVSFAALVASAKSRGVLRESDGLDELVALADSGDAPAQEVFAKAAQRLAQAAAGPLAAIDPEVVFVAGEGTSAWRHWDSSFRQTLARRLPPSMRDLPVEVDEWDESNWAHGAAAIVLATPFDRHALAGHQRPEVLARLHGSAVAADGADALSL
jgi:predicted NBD/HSP70 family sugar kinase